MRAKLVIITLLAGIGFFNFHNMLKLPMQRAMFMFMLLVCLGYALTHRQVKLRNCSYPRLPWFVLMVMLVVSTFMASFYHPQSITASIIAQSTSIMAFGSFFILMLLNPDPDRLIRYLWYTLPITFIVFVANFLTIPHNIFGEPMIADISRGIMRVRIPLLQVVLLLFFYAIGRWHTDRKKWRWIALGTACYLMIILSVTRQAILFSSVLGFFFILQNFSWIKKIVLGLFIASVGYLTFTNLPMYDEMKEISEEQLDDTTSDTKEDVRIGAWRYYGYEANETVETFLLGNGTPSAGKSLWGKRFDSYAEETGYLTGDVSYPACIFMYGIIFTISLLLIIILAIIKKKAHEHEYLTYFMLASLLQGVASGVWFYYEEIFINMIALYLIYTKVYSSRNRALESRRQPTPMSARSFVTE